MDTAEALQLLNDAMQDFRREPYHDLVRRIAESPIIAERQGAGSAQYQLELEVMWEHRPGGNVIVIGSIDDGGWRAFSPLTRSFIKAPDDSFVGE